MSYRWGIGKRSETIVVEDGKRGATMAITQSAHEILAHQQLSADRPFLWIDSICINQNDVAEKTSQVRIMRDIYSRASRVIVWLGHAPDADVAWYFFGQMLTWQATPVPQAARDAATYGINETNNKHPGWRAFAAVLENDYWWRVWIVQEIVVARHVVICYGGFWWGWNAFVNIVKELLNTEYGLLQKLDVRIGMVNPPNRACHQINSIRDLRDHYHHTKPATLERMLLDFAESKSGWDEDQVFGFQGISTAKGQATLMPDYSKPTLQVYRDVTLFSLNEKPMAPHFQPFSILSVAGVGRCGPTKAAEWPSWVPDFAHVSKESRSPRSLCYLADYKAGQPHILRANVSQPAGEASVVIQGIVLDEILAVTKLPPVNLPKTADLDNGPEMARMIMRQSERLQEAKELAESRCADAYPNGHSRWEAFWRTHMGNTSPKTYPAAAVYGDHFRTMLETHKRSAKTYTDASDYLAGRTSRLDPSSLTWQPGFEDLSDQMTAAIKKPGEGGSAATTLRTLERMFAPYPVRHYLTAELLDDRPRLLRRLAAATGLPAWAVAELEKMKPRDPSEPQRAADPNFINSPQAKAWTELMRGMGSPGAVMAGGDPTLNSLLTTAFLMSGSHIDASDDLIDSMRRLGEANNRSSNVAHNTRVTAITSTASGMRRFAVTRRGYMALVPVEAREGDVTCVFVGAMTPHVLRPGGKGATSDKGKGKEKDDGRFLFVGEAYVHGFMDGEAFQHGSVRGLHIE